jgi:hypothetical protein
MGNGHLNILKWTTEGHLHLLPQAASSRFWTVKVGIPTHRGFLGRSIQEPACNGMPRSSSQARLATITNPSRARKELTQYKSISCYHSGSVSIRHNKLCPSCACCQALQVVRISNLPRSGSLQTHQPIDVDAVCEQSGRLIESLRGILSR